MSVSSSRIRQNSNCSSTSTKSDWQTDFVTLSDTVDARVKATGIPFFASANNFSADACKFTPANLAYTNANRLSHRSNPSLAGGTVFSVGGTSLGANGDMNDYRWQTWDNGLAAIGQDTGSNGGSCVSIFAPAADIYAARASRAILHSPTLVTEQIPASVLPAKLVSAVRVLPFTSMRRRIHLTPVCCIHL